jgi:ATP-binding cassette subfamily B protein
MAYSQPPPRESQRFSVPPGAKPAGKAFRRPLLAPEIIQISSIDCGVAATACLLRGCGIPANYERLREACQTDVDGTSIDTLQEIINRIGFQFIQHLLPEDSFLSEAELRLPAIVPISTPGGAPHFVVLWRRIAGFWQVMDPSRGRRWLSDDELRQSLHRHVQMFEPREFREWAEQSSCRKSMVSPPI